MSEIMEQAEGETKAQMDGRDFQGVPYHSRPDDDKCAVWLSSGNKGGVCKSLLSIFIADYLWRKGVEPVIGDAEKANVQRTFMNTMSREGMIPEDESRVWNFDGDLGFEKFLDELLADDMRGKKVVVDTGANSLPEFIGQLAFLHDVLEDGKLDFHVNFVCGPLPESAEALKEFVLADKGKVKTTVITIGPDDIPLEEYPLMGAEYEGLRKLLKRFGIPVVHIGRIPERFFAMVMRDPALPPAQLSDKMTGVGRRRLERWIELDLNPAMAKITGITEA